MRILVEEGIQGADIADQEGERIKCTEDIGDEEGSSSRDKVDIHNRECNLSTLE